MHTEGTSRDPVTNDAFQESLSPSEILFVFDVRGRVNS